MKWKGLIHYIQCFLGAIILAVYWVFFGTENFNNFVKKIKNRVKK
jgi:hypothetical protein